MRRCLAILVGLFQVFSLQSSSQAQETEPNLADSKPASVQPILESTVEERALVEDDYQHWAFQPLQSVRIPEVQRRGWASAGLDHFVLAGLEKLSLDPAPQSDPAAWLRRVKFDLLGLPPTVEEVEGFLADQRPDADQIIVDRWLASPLFGQRWAQYWLDLARFAETDGFEHDKVRDNAWQYRDWVIDALNSDMPYDQFIGNQLAGDFARDVQQHVATMFCLAGADMPDINDQALRRHDRLNELTSTIGSVLMGLQLQCAQCHDHKTDPISQADFYRLRAIFEPAVPELKRDKAFNLFVGDGSTAQARLYHRGELTQPGALVAAGVPRIANGGSTQPQVAVASNPRLALVDWLFLADNPLTARVIVNRLWQQHFKQSLLENPSDVGVMASQPAQQALLDWLAEELQRRKWSMKQLHRQIVLSATYRQSSMRSPLDRHWQQRLANDPDNQWYSRFPRYRLEGEAVRDSLLAVSGLIQLQSGGPSVRPPLPAELTSTLLKGQWQSSEARADHMRRSIYVFARRNLRYPLFEVFDRPDAVASCPRRDRSTTALQSLHMLNGDLTLECAQHLLQRWQNFCLNASGASICNASGQRWLFLNVLGRPPSEGELELLGTIRQDEGLAVCVALLNTSEFLYVD